MEHDRLLQCLADDYGRLREVSGGDAGTGVPSCPGWTVGDLLYHVAQVYLHKVECIRLRKEPDVWPPDLSGQSPTDALEAAYTQLAQTLASKQPSDAAYTWFDPDQTVGFWIRRMAHETVIHRRDAELAFGKPTPAPADLAEDGIDELLDVFLAWATTKWASEIAEELAARKDDTVLVAGRLLRFTSGGVRVERGATEAALRVSGSSSSLLFWLWNRLAESDDPVSIDGDPDVAERFRQSLILSTQ